MKILIPVFIFRDEIVTALSALTRLRPKWDRKAHELRELDFNIKVPTLEDIFCSSYIVPANEAFRNFSATRQLSAVIRKSFLTGTEHGGKQDVDDIQQPERSHMSPNIPAPVSEFEFPTMQYYPTTVISQLPRITDINAPMDCRSLEDSLTVENRLHGSTDQSICQNQLTIDKLPDDALLYVFDFYVAQASEVEAWHTLVHVSRRWRNLVFGSPRRLNLQIVCTNETPIKEKLDVWPALPIVISGDCNSSTNLDNVKAAFEHHDRVCKIKLFFVVRELEDITALLEEPFPILTDLGLSAVGCFRPFKPDPSKFLGGSARLQSLHLSGIRIPDLLKLLLSTPNLVVLRLDGIRNSSSILTDEMVNGLSALTRLEQLDLHVEFNRSHPDWENRRLPLLTRTVLPSLTVLNVRGTTENLEDFMARIDAPQLCHLDILFSLFFVVDQVIVFDTPHLLRFISRIQKLQAPDEAYIGFDPDRYKVWIRFFCSTRISRVFRLEIFCAEPERQFPGLAQFCRSPHFPLHPLENLCIGEGQLSQRHHANHPENTRWLELLQPFAAVKNLYLTKEFAPHIAHALEELVGERVMEVLPSLENVFINECQSSRPVREIIKGFTAARQLAGHPIIISLWDKQTCQARRR